MSFWKEEMVLELMKYRYRNLAITITLKAKWLTVSVLDSWVSSLLPSWERDGNWRGIQSNLQVSTASGPDAEWRLDTLSPFTGHGSSLISGTMWPFQSHPGTQCLTTQVPSAHVTSTTIYTSTPNHLCYLFSFSAAKSQERNEVAVTQLHCLASRIHYLFLIW